MPRRYNLVGSAGTCGIVAHSAFDAGARYKGDPDFYNIGELQFIEEIASGAKKFWNNKKRAQPAAQPAMRQTRVRVEFSF